MHADVAGVPVHRLAWRGGTRGGWHDADTDYRRRRCSGRVLTDGLAVRGFALRLSDRRTDYAPLQGLEYHAVELADRDAVAELCRDIDVVVHFGGVSTESSFEAVLDANLRGCFHVFEGARAAGVGRVVFASSNHAIGMYPRTRVIDASAPLRPDSYYGLSKAYR